MDQYLKGKGVKLLFQEQKVNNLTRLSSQYGIEKLDYVFLSKFLKSEKFAHIFLKELFFILKPQGYLIISYNPMDEIDFRKMEGLFWWLFKGNYEIVTHKITKGKNTIVVRKRESMFSKNDSIDKWTFGIITNGDRDDWMEEIITSIKNLKIPNYEIIVCGKYKDRKEKNFNTILFNERPDKGWITRKKNLICEKARYENLCIIHDRLVFDKNWYKGMKKYGNDFELLGCRQEEKNGVRAGDWLTLGGPIPTNYRVSQLKDTDWEWYTYLSGQLTIIKKTIWQKVLWDENRYWNEAEDADITYRARDMGYMARFNPHSLLIALSWRHGALPLKYNIREGIMPKDMYKRRVMRITARVVYKIPLLRQSMLKSYHWFSKTKLYKHFIYN